MKAALDNILQIKTPQKLAIIGDMLELGEKSIQEHKEVVVFCQSNNLETFFIGEIFYALKNEQSQFFRKVEDCNYYLQKNKIENKLVLLKGSRGIHLEEIMV
jgi:UDP-N-acetylmuramoyl-tripeptide--D-alanyl-D-alanine ligase